MKAVPFFEDAPCYPSEQLVRLRNLGRQMEIDADNERRKGLLQEFCTLRDSLTRKGNAPKRIYLWPEGEMPVMTQYKDNYGCRYNHNPDFRPYLYEMLLPSDRKPKGAIIVCAGGDHGDCVVSEGYQTCLDFNKMGYHSFLLLNRPNRNPWTEQECGADTARAIRMVRAAAGSYGIRENQVAFAGFSNGGLTGEACIRYYSGTQKQQIIFRTTGRMIWTAIMERRMLFCVYTDRVIKVRSLIIRMWYIRPSFLRWEERTQHWII